MISFEIFVTGCFGVKSVTGHHQCITPTHNHPHAEASQEKKWKLARTDDVHLLNNSKLSDYVHSIYPIILEIEDTTNTARSASYLDLHLSGFPWSKVAAHEDATEAMVPTG